MRSAATFTSNNYTADMLPHCNNREVSHFVILFVVEVMKLVFETGVNFVIRV